MGKDITQIYTLGPSTITYNGVDLGHTDDAGVKITRKINEVTATAGKFGKAPVGIFYDGETVEVDFILQQTDFTILASAFPKLNTVTGSGKTKLTTGNISGTKITAAAMVIQSLISALDPLFQVNLAQAVPVGDFIPVFTGGKIQGWACKFHGVVNESGGSDGSYMLTFGDPTATADAVAPVVSAVVPLDNAAGVAEATTVVWTISKALNGLTVNTASVMLVKDNVGAGAVAGAVALANNGASTTITFTPTSSLSTGKYYAVLAPNVIKDLAGNLLAGYESDFTCV